MKTLVAAIEFGTSKIVTVIAQSSSRNEFEIISCGKVDYSGYKDGDWVDRNELNLAVYNSIVAAQSEAGFQISEIYIGVPCEFIHVYKSEATVDITGENGRVSREDIEYVEDMAADKFAFQNTADLVIHRSPAWYCVDGGEKQISIEGRKGDSLSACVSFITAVDYFIDDMREIMGQVGITINGFLSPSFAQVISCTTHEDRDRGCILIDSGCWNTEFSVVKGDAIVYHAVLPFGGADITQAIAEKLLVPIDEAEALKRDTVVRALDDKESAADEVSEICETKLGELCEYLKRTEEECRNVLVPRSCIYLNGGGIALLRGAIGYLEQYMDRDVKTQRVQVNKLGGPEYAGMIALIDMILDSIERKPEKKKHKKDADVLPAKALTGLRGLFGKRNYDD